MNYLIVSNKGDLSRREIEAPGISNCTGMGMGLKKALIAASFLKIPVQIHATEFKMISAELTLVAPSAMCAFETWQMVHNYRMRNGTPKAFMAEYGLGIMGGEQLDGYDPREIVKEILRNAWGRDGFQYTARHIPDISREKPVPGQVIVYVGLATDELAMWVRDLKDHMCIGEDGLLIFDEECAEPGLELQVADGHIGLPQDTFNACVGEALVHVLPDRLLIYADDKMIVIPADLQKHDYSVQPFENDTINVTGILPDGTYQAAIYQTT